MENGMSDAYLHYLLENENFSVCLLLRVGSLLGLLLFGFLCLTLLAGTGSLGLLLCIFLGRNLVIFVWAV